ncbi:MAG: YlbF family regulator [Streptococcaceae bacterium]|jgi:cell fate (sporulation/competence/biofilm development) regulator YlbF (YheA/YmcA/DUF963 family)|nr:YlbF family regulator [Streptococcaceae bacterium]
MLIYNESLAEAEQILGRLVDEIKASPVFLNLKNAKRNFNNDSKLQEEVAAFLKARDLFLEQEQYIAFRPELKAEKLALIRRKRQLDMYQLVMDLKFAENEMQQLLDDVLSELAEVFSDKIELRTSNPISKFKKGGHHGKCIRT